MVHKSFKIMFSTVELITSNQELWALWNGIQTGRDNGKYFFQNWAKNVPLGGIGYKSNIDPSTDLTNYIIDSAIIMHAVKVFSHMINFFPISLNLANSHLISVQVFKLISENEFWLSVWQITKFKFKVWSSQWTSFLEVNQKL